MKSLIKASILFLGFASTANAAGGGGNTGFIFNPAIYYGSTKVETSGSTSEGSSTYIDARLGYAMSSGLYLGGYYGLKPTKSGSTTLNHNEMGADLGYYAGAFNILATYILSAEDDQSSTTKIKGSGLGVTLGYIFGAGGWGFGPQVTYSMITYNKQVSSGTESTISDIKVTSITPKFAFWFRF